MPSGWAAKEERAMGALRRAAGGGARAMAGRGGRQQPLYFCGLLSGSLVGSDGVERAWPSRPWPAGPWPEALASPMTRSRGDIGVLVDCWEPEDAAGGCLVVHADHDGRCAPCGWNVCQLQEEHAVEGRWPTAAHSQQLGQSGTARAMHMGSPPPRPSCTANPGAPEGARPRC
jgi:hypothetical protein